MAEAPVGRARASKRAQVICGGEASKTLGRTTQNLARSGSRFQKITAAVVAKEPGQAMGHTGPSVIPAMREARAKARKLGTQGRADLTDPRDAQDVRHTGVCGQDGVADPAPALARLVTLKEETFPLFPTKPLRASVCAKASAPLVSPPVQCVCPSGSRPNAGTGPSPSRVRAPHLHGHLELPSGHRQYNGGSERFRHPLKIAHKPVGGKAGLPTQAVSIQSLCVSSKLLTWAHGSQHSP